MAFDLGFCVWFRARHGLTQCGFAVILLYVVV